MNGPDDDLPGPELTPQQRTAMRASTAKLRVDADELPFISIVTDWGTTAEEQEMTTEYLASALATLLLETDEEPFKSSLHDVEDVAVEGREVWPPALRLITRTGARFKITIEREL